MDSLVTIGMPVRNCERSVEAAIRSMLNQTYRSWELLIVDDGSEDNTAGRAARFRDPRIRLLADGVHAGLPVRLNQAVRLGWGKYFARMDGDDISFPERLERQVAYLEAHPEVDLLAASVVVFKGAGEIIGERRIQAGHDWICRRPWGGFPMPHPTWMGTMEWFRKHPYDKTVQRAEDQELLLRTYGHSRFAGIDEVLLGYCEERLSLRRIYIGRKDHVGALLRQFRAEGRYGGIVAGIAGHGARMLQDVAAIGSGLNYLLLPQRAKRARPEIVRKWRSVWEINQAGVFSREAATECSPRHQPWVQME